MLGRTINVGIIGLGVMGRTHAGAFVSAAAAGWPCRLAAVADPKGDAAVADGGNLSVQGGPVRTRDLRVYTRSEELLADPGIDAVSICTPTDTHVDLAIRALSSGKHVLVEKPVALLAADVRRLAEAARTHARVCMPAMCMRFWPGWTWLREAVKDGRYGAVRSATFQRLGAPPTWGRGFYDDYARSGGPATDLHIHDADFVRWCFGDPDQVISTGTLAHITTIYRYRRGPAHVVAEGGQDLAPGFGFRMRYMVAFESATADFDLDRATPLRLCRDGRQESVELPATSGYEAQARHFIDLVAGRPVDPVCTIDDAVRTASLLERERACVTAPSP
jgi:predicted dehydrogenase